MLPNGGGVQFTPGLAIFFLVSAVAAVWVYLDHRTRAGGPAWERTAWWLGTLLALPIFLPIYLIAARLPGGLVRCLSCGRLTVAHRAACRHCGNPIAFEPSPGGWGLGEMVGVSIVFILTLPLVAAVLGVETNPTLPQLSVFSVAQNVFFIVLTLYVVRARYHLPVEQLGIRFDRWRQWGAWGLLAGGLSIPLSTLMESVSVALIGMFVGRPAAEQMASQEHVSDVLTGILQGSLSPWAVGWILLLVCVLVPVGEEVFFRGFVYGALRRWGVTAATVLSSLFFAAVHQQIVHFLPIFVLGVLAAGLYEWTGSLLPAVLVHAVNNVVAVLGSLYGWNI